MPRQPRQCLQMRRRGVNTRSSGSGVSAARPNQTLNSAQFQRDDLLTSIGIQQLGGQRFSPSRFKSCTHRMFALAAHPALWSGPCPG